MIIKSILKMDIQFTKFYLYGDFISRLLNLYQELKTANNIFYDIWEAFYIRDV